MSKGALETRIEKLEAKRLKRLPPAHRVTLESGASEAEARASYELATGRKIHSDDLIVLRVMVDPA